METIASYLVTAFYIAACIFLFSLAIAIHEFGHFIVALKLSLKVERFSIGFGPAIWKKTFRGVEYRICWIPLGGYVSIPEVDPEGTRKLEGGGGNGGAGGIAQWKQLLVAVAGPAMNIVLAAAIAAILSLVPSARFSEPTTEIGSIKAGGKAESAGLRIGDTVAKVNGRAVASWVELCLEAQYSTNAVALFEVSRPVRETVEVEVTPSKGVFGDDYAVGVMSAGVVRGGRMLPWIGVVTAGSPAERAGLRGGDEIVSVGGKAVGDWGDFTKAVKASGGGTLKFAVSRKSAGGEAERLLLEVPVATNAVGMLVFDAAPAMSSAAPWMASRSVAGQLADDAGQIFYVLKRLCTDTKETSKQLGGPVMIAESIYTNIRRDTWDGLGFLRFLNVNLAVLNLLPIPVLDGGLILFALIGMLFRRPVPAKVTNALSTIFMWLLLAAMAVLVWRDITRSAAMHMAPPSAEEKAGDAP